MKVKVKIYPKCIFTCDGIKYLRNQRDDYKQELSLRNSEVEDLQDILQKDTVIAMRKENGFTQIIGFQNRDISETYFYQLGSRIDSSYPRTKSLGAMYLFDRGNKTVVLHDWHVRDEDRGHGTYFLSSVQQYLRENGYYCVSGKIRPVDYCRLDKLKHLYTKLGFQIKDCEDSKHISCVLRELDEREQNRAERSNMARWIQALDELTQTNFPQKLGLTNEQFFRLCMHPLFQSELLKCVLELSEKHKHHWNSITTE